MMKEYFIDSILDFGEHEGKTFLEVFIADYHDIEWYLEVMSFFYISKETLSKLQDVNSHFQFSDKALRKIETDIYQEPTYQEAATNQVIDNSAMINKQNEIELKIKADKEKALDESMWGKPANDIITGIQSIDKVKPERALWEMVQNARDVSVNEGAEIVFERRADSFVFRHNGMPFENKSLVSLNLQTSSKVRNDIVQIGQYGTGFLTTHKFGLKFMLSGALKVYEDGDDIRFYNFDKFLVDRSPNDKFQMIANLKDQQNKIDDMGCSIDELSSQPYLNTEFFYKHENDIELARVKDAIKTSPDLTPFVLALNDRINKVSFNDSVDNQYITYERNTVSTIEETDKYSLVCVEISKHLNNEAECIKVFLLESSNKRIENCNSSKVTVILPIKEFNGGFDVFSFPDTIPSLFLYLPLVGTERWGLNYIIHSPLFTCENDSRDSLRFVGNGQNNDDQARVNKELIDLSYELVTSFINNNLSKSENSKYFAPVSFATNDINNDLAEYYKLQQDKWVKYFEEKNLVLLDDNYIAKPINVKLLGRDLYFESLESQDFLDAICGILSLDKTYTTPNKEDILFWSNTVYNWYNEESDNRFISLRNIAETIEKLGATAIGLDNILCFSKFLIRKGKLDIFDKYSIIPTEKNTLHRKNELQKPASFSNEIRGIMEALLPNDISTFVHPQFAEILTYQEYTIHSLKEALSSQINELQTEQSKENSNFKSSYVANGKGDTLKMQNLLYKGSMVGAMMRLFNMQIIENSDSFASKIFKQLKLYYNYGEVISEKLDSTIFDYKQICRTLVYNTLLDFTIKTETEKALLNNWIQDTVRILFERKDFSNMLLYYMVYPNQENAFRYSDQIKKEKDLPEKLKDLYDIFVNEKNAEDLGKESIRNTLLSSEYNNYFISSAELQGYDLASKIFERIKVDSDSYPDISNYKYKDQVLEIIQNLDEVEDSDLWCKLFPNIEKDKPLIMMSVINDKQRKSSLFKIMRYDDFKFDKISKLAENPDFDLIIKYGEEYLQNKRNEESDFQYKKSLGEYVELFLRKELQNILETDNLQVENCQGGQDIIINYDNNPIYYIEVKSRWQKSQSVLMSALQLERSVLEKDNYALCVVDMTDYPKELVYSHKYPSLEETIDKISVVDNIGIHNEALFEMVDNENVDSVHIGGSYQIVVPQDFIKNTRVSFEVLLNNIKERFKQLLITKN